MPETGARQDPIPAFRFEIRIPEFAVGGFSECSGLQLETEVWTYPEGGWNHYERKRPTRTRQSNIVLKRGIVDRIVWDWYFDLTQGNVERKDGSILVYDPSGGSVLMHWVFKQAFPCKWSGPDLNASQSNVAVESLELCHEGLVREE